ncbi:MAG: GFA family protein [Proteobacteria bacterium]|nr:MAG: GFA family protein [Pseudomonadota bacterium]
MDSFRGSCLCQSVTYEATGEVQGFYLCHCSHCRKISGSAHGANIFIKVQSFNWLTGEDKISHYNLQNTRFEKAFCPNCSSTLPVLRGNGHAVIPAGSLDSDFSIKPNAHIHYASRMGWDHDLEKIKTFQELPDND